MSSICGFSATRRLKAAIACPVSPAPRWAKASSISESARVCPLGSGRGHLPGPTDPPRERSEAALPGSPVHLPARVAVEIVELGIGALDVVIAAADQGGQIAPAEVEAG